MDLDTLKNYFYNIIILKCRDYQTLTTNGIDVFSVKTDAFTIKEKDSAAAQACLRFHNDIGGWRCSKQRTLNCQVMLINIR